LILERTQGTPFFMEELVQTLVEDGALVGERGHYRVARTLTELHISPTVQGVLAARIDRLASDEKALLQQLSVIGRQFPLSLIRQAIAQPEADLYRLLASLQHKEFLYEQPSFPESEYIFKHALTQEVAYGTVLQEQRKLLHERTGQALEALYATTLHEHYSDLAHHYRRSPNMEKAIHYLHLAGQQAVQRSANTEAMSHLTAALDLLLTRPETPKRIQQELVLQTTLGPALMALKGYGVPELEQLYTRSRELCRQLGEPAQSVWVLLGLWAVYYMRAEHAKKRAITGEILRLAQSVQDPAVRIVAHYVQIWDLFIRGEGVPAREHYEQLITLYGPQQHRSSARYGLDFGVGSRGVTTLVLWLLGYPEQALKRIDDTLALAHALSHPHSEAFALYLSATLHHLCREGHVAQERAAAAIALSHDHGFPLALAWGTILHGWALTEQAQGEAGVIQLRQGLAAWQTTVGEAYRPYFLTLLAEAYGRVERVEDGLATVAEALRLVEKTNERWYEAEVYRIKGELTLQLGTRGWGLGTGSTFPQAPSLKHQDPKEGEQEAEGYFLKAIEIARKQQAKSLELRATMSLARLWQQQGKTAEAWQLLAEIYGWFTEGFDTADLKDAKVLLGQLV
ncbi:MAG: hypothetical protein HY268_30995, partial [Deltaproteobacteria bacterium]|nr:hypothetical protein [Deltaproteobacteria bacterium]